MGDEGAGRAVVVRDADIGFQASVFVDGEAVEAGEVQGAAVDAPCTAVFQDVVYLPALQSEAHQLGGVGRVGVEGVWG